MKIRHMLLSAVAGFAAGGVTGIFGAGGGMVLIPLLTLLTRIDENALFPTSLSIMLPICVTTLIVTWLREGLVLTDAAPYLIGSAAGGILAGICGKRIPVSWLHRGLGLLILWGGIRYLC